MRNKSSISRRHRLFLSAIAAIQAVTAAPTLFASTWIGTSSEWSIASNWSPSGIPNSLTTPVVFADSGLSSVNISTSVSVQSLTFNNTTSSYVITSTANQTLTLGSNTITSAATTGSIFINPATVASGSLLYSTGPLIVTNNSSTNAPLSLAAAAVIGTPGVGGIVIQGTGPVLISSSFATVNTSTAVVGGITKNGSNTFTYTGNGTNLKGNITLNGGTTIFDYSLYFTSKVFTGAGANSTLVFNGGDLQFNTAVALSQSIPLGLVVNAGQASLENNGTGGMAFAANTITHNVGGTLDFTVDSTFSATTTTGVTNSLLGSGPAFATINGGATWATVAGGSIVALTSFGTNVYATGVNTDVTSSATVGTMLTNSLRFNTGNPTLTLSGTNTLQSGGILVTPSAAGATITGGTLTAPSGGELIVNDYATGNVTIGSALVSSVGLTKTGSGTLTLSGSNPGLTGPINLNRGNLTVTNIAAISAASALNFNDTRQGIALQIFSVDLGNGNSGTLAAPIRLSADGTSGYGTAFVSGANSTNSTITLSGVISSNPNTTNTSISFSGNFSDTAGYNLTNPSNTFTGAVDLFSGFLGITADGSLGNPANTLLLQTNDGSAGGLIFLNSGINIARPITVASITRLVVNGTDSDIISGAITGTNGFVKDGTGTLTLTASNTISGNITVNAGTLALTTTGSLGLNNMTINPAATFIANPSTGIFPHTTALTLNAGTFRANTGSGNIFVAQIATGSAGGTIDLTGASAYAVKITGAGDAITINGNSTWLSPGNNSTLINFGGNIVPIAILPGVTLTNGIALAQSFLGFQITGGGTLFQNSDATNQLVMNANITVSNGTFRVTDVSGNSGVGNLGTGLFTLDGGTFSYGGISATSSKSMLLSSNGGAINVESAATTLTLSNSLSGIAPLTKSGPGTLILTNSANSFSSLTVTGGTLSTPSDATLGTGPITLANAASILFSATTASSRTFNLNAGSLLSTGGTLTLNGATINGGFLRGSGSFTLTGGTTLNSVTTFSNALLIQSGAASFTAFTNGGTLNNIAPLSLSDGTNNFTGTINISSAVTAQNFGSTGVITINPGGSLTNAGSNLILGGGSRTFLGNISSHGGTITLTGGTTLEVNGALLVNDGTISGTTNVNFGGVAQGVGSYGPVNVSFGGIFQPGFASSGIINNGALVTALNGTGTIDNTSTGNMTLTLTGSSTSSFSGPIQNSAGSTSLAIQGTSSLTLLTTPLSNGFQSVNTFTGGLSIANGASVTIGAVGALPNASAVTNNGSLTINATSTASVLSGIGTLILGPNTALTLATSSGGSKQGALSLTPSSTFNINNNQLVIEASSSAIKATDLSQIAALVASGKSTGFGITSSALGANLGLAVIDNATLLTPFTLFGGQQADANSILIAPELLGDANIDGHVDLNDLNTVLNNLGRTTGAWNNGNFDGAATIDLNDLNAVLNHLGTTYANSSSIAQAESLAPATPTPEPASLTLLAVASSFLLTRRRR